MFKRSAPFVVLAVAALAVAVASCWPEDPFGEDDALAALEDALGSHDVDPTAWELVAKLPEATPEEIAEMGQPDALEAEDWPFDMDDGMYLLTAEGYLYRYAGTPSGDLPAMQSANPTQAPTPEPDGQSVTGCPPSSEVEPRCLFEEDSRLYVRDPHSWFPARAVGRLMPSDDLDAPRSGCTAALIGPRHAVTSAHCVLSKRGGVMSQLWFAPGQDGDGNRPLGAYPHRGVLLRVKSNAFSDYAVIGLHDSPTLAEVGNFGLAAWDDPSWYEGRYAYLKGYPLPTDDCGTGTTTVPCGGWQWSDGGVMDRPPQPGASGEHGILYYPAEATNGQSGAPVYLYADGEAILVAVHKQSNCQCAPDQCAYRRCPADYNIGPLVTPAVRDDLCWMMRTLGPSAHRAHPCAGGVNP